MSSNPGSHYPSHSHSHSHSHLHSNSYPALGDSDLPILESFPPIADAAIALNHTSHSHNQTSPIEIPRAGPTSSSSRPVPHSHYSSNSNEISSAVPSSPVPLMASRPADSRESAKKKRRRRSSLPSVSDAAKIHSFAVKRNTYLSLLQNYIPFRLEMKPVQIYSTAPSIAIRVWLIGFNNDPTSGILRRKDGLHLYMEYSENGIRNAPVFHHAENLNQPALCSLLARIAGNSLVFNEFHSHIQSKKPISAILGKFHVTSTRQLLYRNADGAYKFLHELLPSSFAIKLKSNIPASIVKSLRPAKDLQLKMDSRAMELAAANRLIADRKDDSETESERSDSDADEPLEVASVSASVSEPQKKKLKLDRKKNSRQKSVSDSSSESIASNPPPIPAPAISSPFAAFSFICIHWRLHSSESAVSLSLFSELARRGSASSLLAIQEIADGTDLEYLLTQINVRVLAALNAPVIPTANSLNEKINRIISFLPPANSGNSSFPATPLRVDDYCLVLLPRSLFDLRVWPLLIASMPLFELNSHSLLDQQPFVKAEPGVGRVVSNDSALKLSQRVIESFIRSACRGTSFWLYSLPSPSIESQFFAPIQANCLYSLESGSPLHKPVLLEWPRDLPFEPAIPLHWARHSIQPAGIGKTQRFFIVIQASMWKIGNLKNIQNAFESPSEDGNQVNLVRAAVSAQPSNSRSGSNHRIPIDYFTTYLVLELLLSARPQPQQANSSAAIPRASPRKSKK